MHYKLKKNKNNDLHSTSPARKLHSKHWVNSSAAEIQVQKQVELRQFHDCQHPVPNQVAHRIDSATIALHER
ncbi:hypothetical protein NC651_019988 [Populus alba x Populus x berolinensis]|nr:hypothetical protein NC651_019988 [Populus alba x Populus x berolinensis]